MRPCWPSTLSSRDFASSGHSRAAPPARPIFAPRAYFACICSPSIRPCRSMAETEIEIKNGDANEAPTTNALPFGRRRMIEALGGASGGAAARFLLPTLWVTPLVTFAALPAHAVCSGGTISFRTSDATCGQGGTTTNNVYDANCTASKVRPNGLSDPTCSRTSPVADVKRTPEGVIFVVKIPPSLKVRPSQFELTISSGSETRAVALFAPSSDPKVTTMVARPITLANGEYRVQLRWRDANGNEQTSDTEIAVVP